MPSDLTAEGIAERIEVLEALMSEKIRQGARLEAVVMVLLSRLGDVSRVTVEEAVALEKRLYGKGSLAGVRKKIAAKRYTLEKRTGEKEARIPVDQIYSGYLPIETWRKALAAQKRER